MTILQQQVDVRFTYPVAFTHRLFDVSNPLLRDVVAKDKPHAAPKVYCVIDEGVAKHHPDLIETITQYCHTHPDHLRLVAPPQIVPGGEAVKNDPALIETLHDVVNRYGLDRHAYIIAIGGGAVLDMVGYAAATAHRGIRLIRVPTTVLAQDDSGVGVKNGINQFGKKNFLGTFATPYAVLNDFTFLTTLEDRDWLGGISEAIKVALLKDPAFFDYIETHASALVARNLSAMEHIVYRCAQLHLDHIATSGDPFELGSSRPLDFGHWAAHKLEQLTDYAVRHGEAVAIGIALDTTYAYQSGFLSMSDWKRVIHSIEALDLPIYHPALASHIDAPDHPDSILAGLREFREHLGGQLTIMLLRGIGEPFEVHTMDTAVIRESIATLEARTTAIISL